MTTVHLLASLALLCLSLRRGTPAAVAPTNAAGAPSLVLHHTLPHRPRARTFNVMDFGARGNGVDKDTAAVRAAIAAVAAAGSGVVLFPRGGRFLTAPFNLTSHCTLYVDAGATLLALRFAPSEGAEPHHDGSPTGQRTGERIESHRRID